jgi:hypothetical protein
MVSCQRHASAALPTTKTRYPLYRRLGGPRVGLGGFESLYGLSYPGPLNIIQKITLIKLSMISESLEPHNKLSHDYLLPHLFLLIIL